MSSADHLTDRACGPAAFFARVARALAHDPHVIGSVVTADRAAHGSTEPELAAWLGLADVTALHQLSLCNRPDPASPTFADEVIMLARYFGCNADRLRALLSIHTGG